MPCGRPQHRQSGGDAGIRATSAAAPPMVDFFSSVSKLLTCANLENEVVKKCGTVPAFQAIVQFRGDLNNCKNALAAVSELRALLVSYFGPEGGCESAVKMWQTGGYEKPEECVEHVRTTEFPNYCSIPRAGGGSPAPAPAR